jgi:hypothetical protein
MLSALHVSGMRLESSNQLAPPSLGRELVPAVTAYSAFLHQLAASSGTSILQNGARSAPRRNLSQTHNPMRSKNSLNVDEIARETRHAHVALLVSDIRCSKHQHKIESLPTDGVTFAGVYFDVNGMETSLVRTLVTVSRVQS